MPELLIFGVLFVAVALVGWLVFGFEQDIEDEEDDEWDFTISYPRKDR